MNLLSDFEISTAISASFQLISLCITDKENKRNTF